MVMIPAKVLVYFQMAQFLMLVMVVSWIYGTFFFLPLCMVIGPTEHFGQLTFTKVKKAQNSLRRMSTVTRRYSRDISRNKGLHVRMDDVSKNQVTIFLFFNAWFKVILHVFDLFLNYFCKTLHFRCLAGIWIRLFDIKAFIKMLIPPFEVTM